MVDIANKNSENQSQKHNNGRFDDTCDTLHTFDRKYRGDTDELNNESYECYYYEKFPPTNDEVEYQKHVLNNHPHKRLYPSLSELAEMGLKPKGKRWEI